MALRSQFDSNFLSDLDTLQNETVSEDGKPNNKRKISKKNKEVFVDRFENDTYESSWKSFVNDHNINVIIETRFDSLSELMTHSHHSDRYVTKLTRQPKSCTDTNTKALIAFRNLVTIMQDYGNCVRGLANYLEITSYEATELIERNAEKLAYSRDALIYVLTNDCVYDEALLDYASAKLTTFNNSFDKFNEKYGCEPESTLEMINDEI